MREIPLVDLSAQYRTIKNEVDRAIAKVINSGQFILGEEVFIFERKFAKFCGVNYAVGVDSGISALELGMRALGIGPGDEVLTPANSFIASSSSISFTGATPVLVDCDRFTYNIDLSSAERKLTQKTRAIMPVHLFGQPADMDHILKFAKKYKLYVVEDVAQAHGARFAGKRVGSFGDFAAFSFYPGKNLGAWGDAGCLVTNEKRIYETVSMMRNYGQKKKYYHRFLAWNRRMDTLQAAILLVKLKYLELWNKKRQKIAQKYTDQLSVFPIELPITAPNRTHVYHQFIIRSKKRNHLRQYLEKNGVSTGIHYPIPIHLQKAYKHLNYEKGDFPVTEMLAKEVLSLPMYPELTRKQISYVTTCIKEGLG